MNRFRTKKKAKETGDASVRPSIDSEVPVIPTVKSSRTFRRGKKNQEPEPKPELDLATALPSSDDFRTSLLMSGLSARFSMLREQDDPTSKIGKASDDSVLFPRRQSRLDSLGFQAHGLSDIAEVSSVNGSIRPPFAYGRNESFKTEGYGTDDDSIYSGSIMNRSKPGEGNNLFGGRQKIYMGSRALYENDVSQSAFQKLREREREFDRQEREVAQSRAESPPLSEYNRNRETSSTTSSGGPSGTRTSTAATSFTSYRSPSLSGSQTPVTPGAPITVNTSLERSVTKTRRLYETGLEKDLHEQQSSAMNRVETLTRKPTLGPNTPPPGLSPTFPNPPSERWDRQQIMGKSSMPNLRTTSPAQTDSGMGTFDFGVRSTNLTGNKNFGIASPPLSPPMSEPEENGSSTAQPKDTGKMKAHGTFPKPAPFYEENKYSQRQAHMQQGRETSPLRKDSSPHQFAPQQQPRQQAVRARTESNATYASGSSGSNSATQRNFLPQDFVLESPKLQIPGSEDDKIASGTFLSSPSGSIELTREPAPEPIKPKAFPRPLDLYNLHRQMSPTTAQRPAESQHPMHRDRPFEQDTSSEFKQPTPTLSTASLQPETGNAPPADSPTLGPATDLSYMVRQHLRSESNSSSIYGGVPSVSYAPRIPLDSSEAAPENEYVSKNNPWETDDWDQNYYGDNNNSQDDIPTSASNTAMTPSLAIHSPVIDTAPEDSRKSSWEKEMETHHARAGSSATQQEQQDFKNELAIRRKLVQENMRMKTFAETDSRSASPLSGPEWVKEGNPMINNALGLLRTKTSRGSFVGKQKDTQSKAMKMLGLGTTTMSTSPVPSKSTFDENSWKQEEEEMLQGAPKAPTMPPGTKAFRQARRDAQRDRERQVALRHQQRVAAEAAESELSSPQVAEQPYVPQPSAERAQPTIRARRRTPSRERKPPPVTYTHRNGRSSQESKISQGPESRSSSRARDRSGSDTSGGRSKSRNGRYRDDLAKAMAEGLSSSGQGVYDDLDIPTPRFMPKSPGTPNMAYQQSPMASPMIGPNSRSRSNSRSGYFDSRLPGIQTGSESPRPSPSGAFFVNPTPPLSHPSPAGSGANTPTSHSAQTSVSAPRKRSVNKSDISEPRFVSSTSTVVTVDLPPGASLQNGSGINAPPIPPVNPRRRQPLGMFGGLRARKDSSSDDLHNLPAATQSSEEMSTFSADEGESKLKLGRKLRKSSSEGGNLNARARQAALASPSPAMPGTFPHGSGSPPRPMDGLMF